MATFPIEYAQRTPSGQTAARPIVADTGAPYRALARLGEGLYELGADMKQEKDARLQKEYELQQFSETQNGKLALDAYDSETRQMLQGINDPEQITKTSQERLSKRGEVWKGIATLPESQQDLDFYSQKTLIPHAENLETLRFGKQQENAFNAYDKQYNDSVVNGGFDAAVVMTEASYQKGIITDSEYRRRMNELPGLQQEYTNEQIRDASQKAALSGTKEDGYKIIQQAQDSGLIDAKDNKELGDSLDNFVSGRIHADNQAKYTAKVESYNDFVGKMQEGTLTYEDVGNSKISNDSKEKWDAFIKNQYNPGPKESSYKAFNKAADVVFQANALQLDQTQAYEMLMEERYVNGTLSDSQFKWAVDKIQNPLPPDVTADLQTVYDDTRKLYGWGKSKQSAAVAANKGLFMWVEQQLKEGKRPTAKEMYAKARWYKSGFKSPYDVGDYEVRGGVVYTVIDYDEDGQPIFEVE